MIILENKTVSFGKGSILVGGNEDGLLLMNNNTEAKLGGVVNVDKATEQILYIPCDDIELVEFETNLLLVHCGKCIFEFKGYTFDFSYYKDATFKEIRDALDDLRKHTIDKIKRERRMMNDEKRHAYLCNGTETDPPR